MWLTLLMMAVAVSLEPFRIGMTILMINRPRPFLQLVTFLAGGFAMGLTVGLIVLFLLRPALGSAEFSLPRVQIVIGALLLLYAAVLATGLLSRGKPDAPSRVARLLAPLTARARAVLDGRSLWTAGAAGLGIALPSIDYLAALTLIVATGAAASVQMSALLVFNVVAFGFVEIPLLCYLLAPERTRKALLAVQDWLRTRRRRAVSTLLVVVGCVLLGVGLASL